MSGGVLRRSAIIIVNERRLELAAYMIHMMKARPALAESAAVFGDAQLRLAIRIRNARALGIHFAAIE